MTFPRHHRAGAPSSAVLLTAVALLAAATFAAPARADFSDYGIASVSASESTSQAGAHPDLTTNMTLKTDSGGVPFARTRDITTSLPAGVVGNPTSIPTCSDQQFGTQPSTCPTDAQVGVVELELTIGTLVEPIYNLKPSKPNVVARLGFIALLYPTYINVQVRSDSDYGVTATLSGLAGAAGLISAKTTLWGDPADASHDAQRLTPIEALFCGFPCFAPNGSSRASGLASTAFLTNPTSCEHQEVGFTTNSYPLPNQISRASASLPDITGCDKLVFNPSISLTPTTRRADAPSGLDVELSIPQQGLAEPALLAPPHLKKAVVTLPEGLSVNPSAADGLGACSEAEIGLISESPVSFNTAEPGCPDSSKVGTVEIKTPVLADQLEGSLYLARQSDNPFHTLLAGYLVAKAPGLILKLAAKFSLDQATGRITATFDQNPQLPFDKLKLHFKGGTRGVLATPGACGTYTTQSNLSPWSSPFTPDALLSDSFTIDSGCVSGFSPSFSAGTSNPQAGALSPFTLSFSRGDTDEELSGLGATLPPGLLASIKGVPLCSEADANAGTCPAGSQVGTVQTGAGVGRNPLFLPGKAYLTGPYKDAPYGLAVVVPALAGPFDLGTVVVRQAIHIDPTDAHVSVASDPFPTILQGIPLRIRRVDVTLDRPGFMVNPTSCDPMAITGALSSAGGLSVPVSSRFQVGGCSDLGFSPKLRMQLTGRGQTTDGKHPALVATLTPAAGQANIKSAQVTLPLSMALDPDNSQHVCDFNVAAAVHGGPAGCPASTIVGRASAVTPLLPHPVSGPVYLVQGLRTNSAGRLVRTLPTLLVPLRGADNVAFDLRATTNVVKNKLVTTFPQVPDAQISSFKLTIDGGRRGILVVTHRQNLCTGKQLAGVVLGGQSGKRVSNSTTLPTTGCSKKAATHRGTSHGQRG
jgi:hypothetical protein